ncbi:MAG: hypothetical protein L0H53_12590 [Candidatus Nitrosocosmicus sp.]|nr:hypothetical protein [Candidatus Nitrosocosmicus sp.]MDN5868655.1 hypothetical protein [Candidatus Nitrosocosmicus sp.]
MTCKSIQLKLQKYYLATASVFVVFGLLNSQSIYGAPDFEQKTLARVDSTLDELVTACSQDTTSFREVCTDRIEESWWTTCAVYYDKLDTCKYGKVENYLKGEGRPT